LNLIRVMPAKGQDMQTSIFLARLMGPVFLVIAIAILTDRAGYRAMAEEFLRSRALIYIAGVMAMLMGLAIVLVHNVWAANWRVIITIFGWLAALGGVFRILFSKQVTRTGTAMIESRLTMPITAAAMLVLGAVLTFYGYFR
jgi:hypothetical protein